MVNHIRKDQESVEHFRQRSCLAQTVLSVASASGAGALAAAGIVTLKPQSVTGPAGANVFSRFSGLAMTYIESYSGPSASNGLVAGALSGATFGLMKKSLTSAIVGVVAFAVIGGIYEGLPNFARRAEDDTLAKIMREDAKRDRLRNAGGDAAPMLIDFTRTRRASEADAMALGAADIAMRRAERDVLRGEVDIDHRFKS